MICGDAITFVPGRCTYAWIEKNVPPADSEEAREGAATMIIADDATEDVGPDMLNIVNIAVHHRHLVFIVLMHALFSSNRYLSQVNQSMQYVSVFKFVRNRRQVHTFGGQIDVAEGKFSRYGNRFARIYMDATKRGYGYLTIDFTQTTPDQYRMRSNILFENNRPMVIYRFDDSA